MFPNDVTHIQFRQGKRHTVEGLYISDNKRLPKALSDHPKPATEYHLKTGQRE
jgi:hypothetical protein